MLVMAIIHKGSPYGKQDEERDFENEKPAVREVSALEHPVRQVISSGAKDNAVADADQADHAVMIQAVNIRNEKEDDCHDFKKEYEQGNNPDTPEALPVNFLLNISVNGRIHIPEKLLEKLHKHLEKARDRIVRPM